MGKSKSFTSMMMGLGMAASLFLGCQQFLGQEDKAPTPDGGVSDAPAEVALKLSVKETDACRALHAQVLAADAAGEATVTLQTDFIKNCIEEVKSSDPAGKVIIPADLIPDDRTRCRWLISEIDGGREELIIKFRYYCPDDCDTLKLVDSVHHDRICRDPDPDCAGLKTQLALMDPKSEEYARLRLFLAEHCGVRDTLIPPKDTVHTDCEILRKKISLMDTATEDYHRALRLFHETCVVTPPKDTVVRHTPCDSLHRVLATLDPASEDYAHIKRMIEANCPDKPPADTLHPVLTYCDSLKRRLSTVDTGSVEYDRILAILHEKCGRPDTVIKPPLPTPCDSLKRMLGTLDPASADYAHIMAQLKERCGGTDTVIVKPVRPNCDSLRRVLAANPDTTSEAFLKARRLFHEYCGDIKPPVDTLPPVSLPRCDSLRLTLSKLDPASEEYARVKLLWNHECVEPKPIDPVDPIKPVDPVVSDCDAIRMKMAALDPASADYAHLKQLLAEKCTVH